MFRITCSQNIFISVEILPSATVRPFFSLVRSVLYEPACFPVTCHAIDLSACFHRRAIHEVYVSTDFKIMSIDRWRARRCVSRG